MASWKVNFLQIRAYSEHPEVKLAAEKLVEAYFKGAVRRRDESLLLRDAKKLIASLWLHPSDMFRFTTKTEHFSDKHRKQVWLTHRVLKLFNLMRQIGWVNDAIPAIPPHSSSKKDGKGMAAIYARSLQFKELLESLTIPDVDANPDLPRLQVTITPEDYPALEKDKVLAIDPSVHKLNKYVYFVIDTLEAQWRLLNEFDIRTADGRHLPKADIYYHSADKGKLLLGGRLYAHFCTYPKAERLGITIDGEEVGSLDLSQLHPNLLLALNGYKSEAEEMGANAPEDAYAMPGYENLTRSHNKVLINILFNSKSEDAAARAFLNTNSWYDEITGELRIKTYKGKSKTKRKGVPVFAPNTKAEAMAYITAYKKVHPLFADIVCTNKALELQSLDSNLAIKVIDAMTQAGLPVLTVHDEFIVRRQDRKLAEITVAAMAGHVLDEVYGDEWGEIGAKWETTDSKENIKLKFSA